ncbi:hypothetical protein P0D69_01630, partial [Paraburkholderia sediminicola]|uniref:hypothetical protein n=1 Tax=Paraburkholderia sediminicola TaxID=458836 RepID=UPI0038BAE248
MNVAKFKALLDGDAPTLEEYAEFVGLAEKLPYELLWTLLTSNPEMNGLLKGIVHKNLQEKVPKANVDAAIDAIATEILLGK